MHIVIAIRSFMHPQILYEHHWLTIGSEKLRALCLGIWVSNVNRPPDKSAYWKIIFFISHPKHMLWVLKRTGSMRRFF